MPRPLTNGTPDGQRWPASWAREPFLYLTTVGRRTGQAHRIEMWFAARGGRLYLLAGSRERADWVRNLQANARVTVELGDGSHVGIIPGGQSTRRERLNAWRNRGVLAAPSDVGPQSV